MKNPKRTAIVTGGASGIGLAITKKFVSGGDHVHVLDVTPQKAKEELISINDSITTHACDVSNQKQVLECINRIAVTGPINILINNAGISHVGNVEETTEADLDRLYAVNVKGVYNCLYAVIPHMKTTGGGSIINLASVCSHIGIDKRFAYSMTKGAVLMMTYTIAKDYLDYNIRCNSISPGRIHTPFVDGFLAKNYPDNKEEMFDKLSKAQPIGRMGQPEEVAALAYFLCSDDATFMTGSDYPIDGGSIKISL